MSAIKDDYLAAVIGRLRYAISAAGSVGLGQYTRVHRKDLETLLEAHIDLAQTRVVVSSAKIVDGDVTRLAYDEMVSKVNRVKPFLTPESATDDQLRDIVDLALNVLAVGKTRGVEPEL